MRRLLFTFMTLLAGACSNSSSPGDTAARATLNVVRQDSTYKPLLSTTGSFWAKAGEGRRVRLVYQGYAATDSGAEFLRFDVPTDGLYRKPDGTGFAAGDSIQITVTVVDAKRFLFDFQPSGLQFNPSDPARLRVEYHYADQDFNGDGTVDSSDANIAAMLSLWRREPPDSLWLQMAAVKSVELEEFDAAVLQFSQYAVAW